MPTFVDAERSGEGSAFDLYLAHSGPTQKKPCSPIRLFLLAKVPLYSGVHLDAESTFIETASMMQGMAHRLRDQNNRSGEKVVLGSDPSLCVR